MTHVRRIILKEALSIFKACDKIISCRFLFRLVYRFVLYYLSRSGPMAEEVMILYNSAKAINARTIVELGVEDGTSTRALLTACYELNAHLWSVDIAPCVQTRRRIEDLFLSRFWTFTQQDDLEFVKKWNKPIDLLFIDTSHQYEHTKEELLQYSRFVVKGGRIFLHDSSSERYPGVARAISNFLHNHSSFEYREHHTRNGLADLIKIN